MRSPTAAMAWSIWRRGQRSAYLVLACLAASALLNSTSFGKLPAAEPVFGILMTLSFLLLMGIFNYSEFNATKEWNGFPYRLFVLPVRTWQLVSLPIVLCVAAVELVYFTWIKIVWTHLQVHMPEWFAIVLGAYAVFYQMTLWALAGFRTARVIALGLGGVSSVAVACLPIYGGISPSPWFSEKRLIPLMVAMAAIAFLISWAVVSRQRHSGGRRQNWIAMLTDKIVDALPRRSREFSSPAAAQLWFEWRRTGWLLPVCTLCVLAFVVFPLTWRFRGDAEFILARILVVPIILAFAIGKGFIKPEFWSTKLSLPAFIAARPLSTGQFVITKMKVAAVSVAMSWILVLGFVALWLPLWADAYDLRMKFYFFCLIYPHSWLIILLLLLASLAVVTWRCMISGLWIGLRGKSLYYFGSSALQVVLSVVLLIVAGVWSDNIDSITRNHPSLIISLVGWLLALAVVLKFSLAAFAWSGIAPRINWQYAIIWSTVTACFVLLGFLSASELTDTFRLEHLIILLALLLFPLARPALAPGSLAANRHASPISFQPPRTAWVAFALLIAGTAALLAMDFGRLRFSYADAGGHKVRMLISGHGSPAVVFETGATGSGGAPLEMWSKVQSQVSQFTTAVSYDRAGVGLSAEGPKPRDARQIARELHSALASARIPPPYILVGHSFGGPFIRVFAGMYPTEVCGMVLVDPTQEEFVKWDDLHNNGHDGIPDDAWDLIQAGLSEAHESRIPPGIPITLITAMGPRALPSFLTEKKRKKFRSTQRMWLKFHQEWLTKVPGARHIVTEDSWHDVPFFEPELVTKSIQRTLSSVPPR
jgi:pimeloyl-ACP methyl ester carboxylesterase